MSLDERIAKLEKAATNRPGCVHGTSLSRVLTKKGREWCLALGAMNEAKIFIYGDSIEHVLSQAEEMSQ